MCVHNYIKYGQSWIAILASLPQHIQLEQRMEASSPSKHLGTMSSNESAGIHQPVIGSIYIYIYKYFNIHIITDTYNICEMVKSLTFHGEIMVRSMSIPDGTSSSLE